MKASVNGIQLTYDVSGDASAPAVVLHHPLATNFSFWDEAAAFLAKTYRVIRFDARGHGTSEATTGKYSFDQLAADTIGLMDHLGVKRAGFVGLSMGGMLAQTLGLKFADRFNCLVIASSSSRVPPEMRHLWVDRVGVAREKGMSSQVEPCLARWLAEDARANPAIAARCTKMIESTPIDGYGGWCGAIETLDMTDKLGGIKIPTRVIVGADDPATPVAASEVIQKAIPGADLVIIPGVSHMLAIEDPAAFHDALTPFLAKYCR